MVEHGILELVGRCGLRRRRRDVTVCAAGPLPISLDRLADESQRIIDQLISDPLYLPRPDPEKSILLYFFGFARLVRRADVPLIEEQELVKREVCIYFPPDLLRRVGWDRDLRYILARALLRSSHPDPSPRAVAFEEALGLFAAEFLSIGAGTLKAVPNESFDSPTNIGGAITLLHYLWTGSTGPSLMGVPVPGILSGLWKNGSDGIVTALHRTYAQAAWWILREFFLWAAEHDLLEGPEAPADPAFTGGVLDHASYWLGVPPPQRHAYLSFSGGRYLQAYVLPEWGRTQASPLELPCQRPPWPEDRLLVFNSGYRPRGTFPSDDGIRWSVTAHSVGMASGFIAE